MNEISCDICMDLMPMVQDGAASEDSCRAVEEHIAHCEHCRALWPGEVPPKPHRQEEVFRKVQRKVQMFSTMLMMFCIFFGLGLTAGSSVFYNCLIMPFIGALGYLVFQWKALYNVPILLFLMHFLVNGFGMIRGIQHLDVLTLIFWTFLYCIFAVVGIVIAGLLHFAFKKEDRYEK